MKTISMLAGATALVASLSVLPAFAQTESAAGANITGGTNVETRIDDIQDAVQDNFDRSNDIYRWGTPNARQGLTGGVSLSYVGRTGNVENQNFDLAGRLAYTQGPFSQHVGIALEFGEDDRGRKDTEDTLAVYDAMYSFNDRLYAFGLGRVAVDGLADDFKGLTADEIADHAGRVKRDAFLGFGPGYRIINTDTTAWRVQAGVGIRYTQTVDFNEADNLRSNTGVGYIVSSRFYHRFNDNVFLTNDTDFLKSDDNKTATNELGVNVKMSDAFSTRVSYMTEYQSDREIRTDNKLGVALVYGF
ncbi:DUF481 domain-containing protein [Paracoccus pacificus]|uniref:YdiY family protein n=1 Tax=Paracoccus pacificus TaxID=1463598 RepID=A0ABW4R412_9RHOB